MNVDEINALHNKFSEYGQSAKHWIRQCQLLLPRIRDEEVWKRKGFSSIYEYAAKLAGMSHASVDEAIRIVGKIQDKPLLRAVVEKKGIYAVQHVASVCTKDTEGFWSEKAMAMSQGELRAYVSEYKRCGFDKFDDNIPVNWGQRVEGQDGNMSNGEFYVGDGEAGEAKHDTVSDKQMISMYMKLDVKTIERMKKSKGDDDWDELLNRMLDAYEGLADSGEVGFRESEEKPFPVNTGKRYIPRKIQNYVTKKTSGLCAYPGCTKPYEILHHTKRFAIDQTHDPDTLKPLCKAHERLAHKGLIENEESQPVEFTAGGCGGEGELSDSGESGNGGRSGVVGGDVLEDKAEIKINWAVKKQPDKTSRKYGIDKKVNEYYMPKLE